MANFSFSFLSFLFIFSFSFRFYSFHFIPFQGIVKYPIKCIGQQHPTDLAIVAKYRGSSMFDKIKVVDVKWN